MTTPQEELRAAVAILTAVHGLLSDRDAAVDNATVVQALVAEHWPDDPAGAVWPLAYVALRAVSLSALHMDTTPSALLAALGVEAAGPPIP